MDGRQFFVFKDTNYGASTTNTATNSALSPNDLADGAIGIYGIDPVLNAGNLSLIINAGPSSGRLVNKADFKGDRLQIYQGTPSGVAVEVSNVIDVSDNGRLSITSQAYIAGTKGVYHVGYNGISGSLNLPTIISRGDEAIVRVNDLSVVQGRTTLDTSYSGTAQVDNATGYQILTNMLTSIYSPSRTSQRSVDADIVSNVTAGAAFASLATANVINGSTAVVTSAPHGVSANDYIALRHNGAFHTYQATAVTPITITLDRPYRGVTALLENVDTRNHGATAPTEVGMRFVDRNFDSSIQYSQLGIIISATTTRTTNSVSSSGRGENVREQEEFIRSSRGQLDNIISYKPQPPIYAVASSSYDIYSIRSGVQLQNSDFTGSAGTANNLLDLAFLSTVVDRPGVNQSDFEDIMTTFFPDFITTF